MKNREAFLRKIALDRFILSIDLSDLRKMIVLLGSVSNNLNQIAKRVNISKNIYKDDIKELQANYEKLAEMAEKILNQFLKI